MDILDNRKYERKPFDVKMSIRSMYKQNNEILENIYADIEISDISHGGVGFFSYSDIPTDYYFNVELVFDKKHYFKSVLKVIRKESNNNKYSYGCEFIGLAENLANMIDEIL